MHDRSEALEIFSFLYDRRISTVLAIFDLRAAASAQAGKRAWPDRILGGMNDWMPLLL